MHDIRTIQAKNRFKLLIYNDLYIPYYFIGHTLYTGYLIYSLYKLFFFIYRGIPLYPRPTVQRQFVTCANPVNPSTNRIRYVYPCSRIYACVFSRCFKVKIKFVGFYSKTIYS